MHSLFVFWLKFRSIHECYRGRMCSPFSYFDSNFIVYINVIEEECTVTVPELIVGLPQLPVWLFVSQVTLNLCFGGPERDPAAQEV